MDSLNYFGHDSLTTVPVTVRPPTGKTFYNRKLCPLVVPVFTDICFNTEVGFTRNVFVAVATCNGTETMDLIVHEVDVFQDINIL